MMLRSLLLVFAVAGLAACGDGTTGPADGDDADVRPDITCDEGSTTLVLECPDDVDLGCIPAAGAPRLVSFRITSTRCRKGRSP